MLIKSLSTSSSTVNSFVKTIRNLTFNTGYRPWESETAFSEIDVKAFKAILFEHLAPFLTRLRNLETINWTHSVDEQPSLYLIAIAQSLSSLPKLRNVAVTIQCHDFTKSSLKNYKLPPLHTFKDLSSLLVFCSNDIPTEYCIREITTAIAASPKLTRLSLANPFEDCNTTVIETCTSLQTLFRDTTGPQLQQLELQYIPFPAAGLNQTLSHRLKSLTISTPTCSRHPDFAWAELFTTLKEIGVELSKLRVTGMEAAMDEMFSYLISYSGGLQTLGINNIIMECKSHEDSAGNRFWDQIVPHHKGSLKALYISSRYEGAWCYGPKPTMAIRQCLSLCKFNIAARRDDPVRHHPEDCLIEVKRRIISSR
ncbi:hypothetical protein MMC31_005323 [Peltigera leucophlebia]|nr:hypothetical protein [Peltigera leucophlebia]